MMCGACAWRAAGLAIGRRIRAARRAAGWAWTRASRTPRAWPRRRSCTSSAGPVHAGSVPAAAPPASGPWSPAGGSVTQRVHAPPRGRARSCTSTRSPRAHRTPARSKRCGATRTGVVRQPAAAATAPSSSGAGMGSSKLSGAAARARRGRRPVTARAAAPRVSAWRRVWRGRGTSLPNTDGTRKVRLRRPATGSLPRAVSASRSPGSCRAARSARRAVRAAAAQHDIVRADLVAEPRRDVADQPLEFRVLERVALAAAVADGVVVMVAARVGRLVARGAVHVDPVHELELREEVERAVHAGEADRALAAAQAVVDLLRTEAALLLREQGEHLGPGAAGPVAGARQLALSVILPGLGHRAGSYHW